jgi:hypothetical protein
MAPLLELLNKVDEPEGNYDRNKRQHSVVDHLLPPFAEGFAGPSADLRQPNFSLLREHLGEIATTFYTITYQESAKKYSLGQAGRGDPLTDFGDCRFWRLGF